MKIQATTKPVHIYITNQLEKENTKFHTFALEKNNSHKVTLKGLPHTIPTEDIKEELNTLSLPIITVRQLKRTVFNNNERTQIPLPVWILTFEKTTDLHDKLHNLHALFNIRIQIEIYKGPSGLTQCYRCQEFGHLATYCKREEKCVRCAGKHTVSSCTQTTTLKCANCNGEHPASYRQCPEYKRLTERNQRTQTSRTFPPVDPNRPAWNKITPPQTSKEEFPALQRRNTAQNDISTEQTNINQTQNTLQEVITLLTNPEILPHLQTLIQFIKEITQNPQLLNNLKLLLSLSNNGP